MFRAGNNIDSEIIRCNKKVCIGGRYCKQHLRFVKGVEIKQSQIIEAGMGVYATKKIPKNYNILEYIGTRYESIEETNPYILQVTNTMYIDASCPYSCTARFVNNCRPCDKSHYKLRGNNCKFSINVKTKKAYIKTTRIIGAGEELFVSYGTSYWKKYN